MAIEKVKDSEKRDLENPLIDKKVYHREEYNEGLVGMVLISTAVAVCGSFEFGSCVGYSSTTQAGIRSDLHLSLSQYSMFGSIVTIGAMIGAITSGQISDFIGRKGVPVYIAEIAPKDLRGGLTTLNQLMIVIGCSFSLFMGNFITWRVLALIGILPCILLLLGLFFIPESPRWLAIVGREKEFEAALCMLRGNDADVSRESAEIQACNDILQALPKAGPIDLFDSKYIRSIIIGAGLMISQQFVGNNGIGFYASQTLVTAGFCSPDIGIMAFAVIQVPIPIVSAMLLDKIGRRPLLLVSAIGTFLGCLLTAIAFFLKGQRFLLEWVPMLVLSGLLIYISGYTIGLGGVPWLIMSEIFPIHVKGVAGSVVVLVNWSGAWIVTYTFNFLISWSLTGTFLIYSGFGLLTILFVAKIVPETKGKTLEEIQALITQKIEQSSQVVVRVYL